MIVLRDPKQLADMVDPAIKALLQIRFHNICDPEPYDPDLHGYFVLVQPGDTAESIEEKTGINLLGSLFSDEVYGDPDYRPDFEYLMDQGHFFEAVYIANDSGFAEVFIVPKEEGIDERILRLCHEFAEFTEITPG